MKFDLGAMGSFYPDDNERKELEKLGFEFKISSHVSKYTIIHKKLPVIEINTLEELVDFCKKWGKISFDGETIWMNQVGI